jgi:hypothetical protein
VASFVNNNKCWFFFRNSLEVRHFNDSAFQGKLVIPQVFQTTTSRKRLEKKTSLPDDDLEKTTGKENKCERKKIKLGTGNRQRESDRKCPKVRESDRPKVVDESDDDLFSINRNDCRRKSRLDSLEDFPGIG